jgi:hypothetical protein
VSRRSFFFFFFFPFFAGSGLRISGTCCSFTATLSLGGAPPTSLGPGVGKNLNLYNNILRSVDGLVFFIFFFNQKSRGPGWARGPLSVSLLPFRVALMLLLMLSFVVAVVVVVGGGERDAMRTAEEPWLLCPRCCAYCYLDLFPLPRKFGRWPLRSTTVVGSCRHPTLYCANLMARDTRLLHTPLHGEGRYSIFHQARTAATSLIAASLALSGR